MAGRKRQHNADPHAAERKLVRGGPVNAAKVNDSFEPDEKVLIHRGSVFSNEYAWGAYQYNGQDLVFDEDQTEELITDPETITKVGCQLTHFKRVAGLRVVEAE